MSAATAPPAPSLTANVRPRPGRAVLRAETLLFFREPGSVFWVMAFPTLLLLILGFIPAMTEAKDELGGLSTVEAYVPVAVLLSMIMAGLMAMPPVITGYRERGILRRMSTTPVRPTSVLGAQVGLHAVASLFSTVLTLAVGRIVSGVALPGQILGYLLTLLLAVVCVLALGALISALSPHHEDRPGGQHLGVLPLDARGRRLHAHPADARRDGQDRGTAALRRRRPGPEPGHRR